MPVEVAVPNLLGGVSQQPPAQRVPGQCEEVTNALLHVVNGLGKRHGTRHIAKLITGLESVRLVHLIERDPTERYVVLVGERRLRVFSADTGAEFKVKVNGSSTAAGRGEATAGTPLNYLDPRTPEGVIDQDEDFVIGAGDWLTTAANSVTTAVAGRGPFRFGRRESTSAVTADTVAEVGNGAAATVSDIFQDFGTFARVNQFSLFIKKSSSAINDVEMVFQRGAAGLVYGARFDIDSQGVVTLGALTSDDVGGTLHVSAQVEPHLDGWYRCTIQLCHRRTGVVLPIVGTTRRLRIRFHTNAATPANKRALLFGGRCYDLAETLTNAITPFQPVRDYVHGQPDLFRTLTISDTTLLLNTAIVAAMDTAQGVVITPLAGYIFVRLGGLADVNYTAEITYTTAGAPTTTTFTFTTGAGPGALQTDDDVAEGLRAAIDLDANLIATRNGNVIKVVRNLSDAVNNIRNIKVRDSRGDTTMAAISLGLNNFGYQITRFTDLPLIMDPNTVVAVVGNPEREADDYYVKFRATQSGSLVDGIWEESTRAGIELDPGILTTIKASTMPQQLRRLQDDAAGTKTGVPNAIFFDVSPISWDLRLVGDEVSNPQPSFIGFPIRDMFLYRGRLGFLADDNVVLSEAGEIFNFWRTTVLDLPDPDPIDVSTGAKEAVEFRNAVATADSLLLFSERRQYQLLGDPVLTPASAQLAAVRAFESLGQCRPVDTGRGALFARSDDAFSAIMEASLLQDDISFRFEDLSVQAPRYIAGRALELAHTSLTGLSVVRSDADPAVLFIHQTFADDQENRLQSALHRWILDADAQVRGMGFLGPELRLVTERAEGWFLETVLTDAETTEGGLPITLLDRRVDESQATLAYAGGPDETTITLPYTISGTATMQVVDAATGLLIPVLSQAGAAVVVRGDVTGDALFVGEQFAMSVALSEPVLQEQSPRGGIVPRMGRPLDLYRLFVYLATTAFLRARVSCDLRDDTTEEFIAAGLGTGLLLEGELGTYTGDTDFSVLGRSTEVGVTLENDTPFPSYVQSARWELLYRARSALA